MYYDDYYEPSEEEIFFDELKEKFKETLKADVRKNLLIKSAFY